MSDHSSQVLLYTPSIGEFHWYVARRDRGWNTPLKSGRDFERYLEIVLAFFQKLALLAQFPLSAIAFTCLTDLSRSIPC